ncbi:MAG TPA: GTPase domain-containing protein [Kofleriaceae bacterium]
MSFVNRMSKEVNCKIVYYGAGLCGKTANLNYVFAATKPESRGKMISLETETERTLFFDFLPLDLGKIGEYKVRFHLYTVPGQVFYDASRKLILKGADGIVFVCDSQAARMEANIESLENLESNLQAYNGSLKQMPHVVQYNKRDMPELTPIEEMREQLNLHKAPEFEAVAKTGQGVFETLKGLAKLVLNNLAKSGV